jgi:hypothetical protein
MPDFPDELITVGNYWSSMDAHLARIQLENAGIRAVLTDEHTTTLNWDLSNAIRGIKLQVLARDAERADQILSAGEAKEPVDPEILAGFDEPEATEPPSAMEEEERPDEPEVALNPREELADRVYRGAIFGMLLIPLQFWVFPLLIRLFLKDDPLRPEMKQKARIAAAINFVMLIVAGWLIGRFLRS